MGWRCTNHLKHLTVCLVGLVFTCCAFNIDVRKAAVIKGQNDDGFGTAVEFIQLPSGETELLVGAPLYKPPDRDNSGVYFTCSLRQKDRCTKHHVAPEPWVYKGKQCYQEDRPKKGGDHIQFGEEKELFGQTVAVLNGTSVMICGPMWSDLCHWNREFIFNTGRCVVVNSGSQNAGYSPYRDNGGVAVLDVDGSNYTVSTDIFGSDLTDTWFGLAVAAGNFCGPKRFCFAVSDRTVFGKIRILEYSGSSFSPLVVLNGTQEYASFGFSLCAVDVNGDGWSDLLVGVPSHTERPRDTSKEDEGRVFVYVSRGEVRKSHESFHQPMTLKGDDLAFARFGSAISSIGDINRDSYADIAIGAPEENEGAGTLYVYLGGYQGVSTRYSQKISGKDFKPPLSSFGYYVSQPTTDISQYGYPDFAVGCPRSNSVVFISTLPIVHVEVTLRADPNPVPPDGPCPEKIDKGRLRASGCFGIRLCFSYSTDTQYADVLGVDYTLSVLTPMSSLKVVRIIDPLSTKLKTSSANIGSTVTTLKGSVEVEKGQESCDRFDAIINEEQVNRNRISPVKHLLQANFALNMTRFADPVPVLNSSVSTTVEEELIFKYECKEGCVADLDLSGQVKHVPETVDYEDINVVNQTRRIDLHLQLTNRGEKSYGVQLVTNLTGQIAFKTAVDSTSAHFMCDSQTNTTSISGVVTGSVLSCSSLVSVETNETVWITLQFEAASVPLEPQYTDVSFHVTAMPYSMEGNPDNDTSNNHAILTSQMRIVANLNIESSSEPRTVHVRKGGDASDLMIQHRLFLTNQGPSFLPPTHLSVSIPQRDDDGRDLFRKSAKHNVTIKYEDGQTASCDLIVTVPTASASAGSNTPAPTTLAQATATTTNNDDNNMTPTMTTLSDLGDERTTPFIPFDPIRPSRRRRREAGDGDGAVQSLVDGGDKRFYKMDCESYRCLVYQCALPAIQPSGNTEVNITLALSRLALPFYDATNRQKTADTLLFVTRTRVAEPDHPLFLPWSRPREIKVQTPIVVFKTGGDEINIWIIVGGVFGGLVLLVILGLIFWKLGCFKRKQREDLQALKRESGFYDLDGGDRGQNRDATESD